MSTKAAKKHLTNLVTIYATVCYVAGLILGSLSGSERWVPFGFGVAVFFGLCFWFSAAIDRALDRVGGAS